jgi:hypothetical protein
MKFALIDKIKTEATKGAKGFCPICNSQLIAKCGNYKVNHWAHKGVRNCDLWWENETEWHRAWKSNFPTEWQEVILTDETTNEKHIADIRTSNGLVIEFQHSYIDPIERIKREAFYKNMIWVVDGARLKRDYPRFLNAQRNFQRTQKQGAYLVESIEDCFPSNWIKSSVPVIFDFKGIELTSVPNDMKDLLYCLYPQPIAGKSLVVFFQRQHLITLLVNGGIFNELLEAKKQPIQQPASNIRTIPTINSGFKLGPKGFVRRRRI